MEASRDALVLPTRAGLVADRLRQMIKSGELPPGTHLRQADFAARFGVSTTPVREAFVTLAREGLLRQDAHRGVIVFGPSVEELGEVYEIRTALEPLATQIATKQLSREDLDELERILAEMRGAEPAHYLELNGQFHARIYRAAERPRLVELINGLRESSANYIGMNLEHYDVAYRAQTQAEHEEILAALRAGAPKRAARAMRDHLENSARHVADLIETS